MAGKARQILIAVDGSSFSEAAFSWYLSNLYHAGDEVHLVHVHDMSQVSVPFVYTGPEPIIIAEDWEEVLRRSVAESKGILEDFHSRLNEKGIKCTGYLKTSHGNAGSEIVKVATEYKVDMVVMGSRGVGTLRRTFLGSSSDYVLHHAECPVLIIKHNQS